MGGLLLPSGVPSEGLVEIFQFFTRLIFYAFVIRNPLRRGKHWLWKLFTPLKELRDDYGSPRELSNSASTTKA